MSRYDAIVIGAGHNGLVAAAMLARAGRRTLVLERSERIGGCTITTELAPGFRCPALAHRAALDPSVIRALGLTSLGLEIIRPHARVAAPASDGRMLTLWSDVAEAAREIDRFSSADATAYPQFVASLRSIGRVLRTVLSAIPPDIDRPGPGDLITWLGAARQFRALEKKTAYRLLRWLTMPVADFTAEWFSSEPLRAAVAADGLLGAFLGPRSAGSTAQLMLRASTDDQPVAPGWSARGGVGAVASALALAAQRAGAEIKAEADVDHIEVREGAAHGVVLRNGDAVSARLVLSSLDPKRTLLGLVDPTELSPEFLQRVEHIRARGTLAKVNYAVSSLPRFSGPGTLDAGLRAAALSGCIRLASHTDALERAFDRAKYGEYSTEPWIELTIPSIADPALAPPDQHVVSAYVQFVPFKLRGSHWETERERLGEVATQAIDRHAPGFAQSIVAREVITPFDLERRWGLSGGHIFHGELALDQLIVARPLLDWARYRTPIRNLYLCGSGTHPGIGVDGRAGMLAAGAALSASRR